jgi:hypothetical protein
MDRDIAAARTRPPIDPDTAFGRLRLAAQSTERWALLTPPGFAVVAIALSFLAMSHYGPGLSPDSALYLSAAKSFVAHGTLTTFNGEPLVVFPPLFPMLAALATLGHFDVKTGAAIVNALAFGGTVLVSGRWMARNVKDPRLVIAGCGAVALSPPLLAVTAFAWSEPLFIFLMLISLERLSAFLDEGRMGPLAASALFAGLSVTTRYVGLAVIVAGVLTLTLLPRSRARRLRSRAAIRFAGIALVPVAAVLARNLVVGRTLAGHRPPTSLTLLTELRWGAGSLGRWFVPGFLQFRVAAAVGVLAGIWAIHTVWTRMRDEASFRETVAPFALFAAIYALTIVVVPLLTRIEPPDDRLVAPAFVPAVVAAIVALDRAGRARSIGAVQRGATLLVALPLLVACAANGVASVARASRHGAGGYATRNWQTSALGAALRLEPPRGRLYSNDPSAVYFLAGLSSRMSPARLPYRQSNNSLADPDSEISDGAYLVWFDRGYRPYELSLDELRAAARLTPILVTADGSVYRWSWPDVGA